MGQKRRQFLIATGALLTARIAHAQQPQKMRRIGYLGINNPKNPSAQRLRKDLTDALSRLGYVEGRNLAIEWRYAEGRPERLPALAEEFVRAQVELIVSPSNESTSAAMGATRTIPIVMYASIHPVESGFIDSYARPGRNITGMDIWPTPQLSEKNYQILKLAVPSAQIAVSLWNPNFSGSHLYGEEFKQRVSSSTKLTIKRVDAMPTDSIDILLERVATLRPDVLQVSGSAPIGPNLQKIAAFAIKLKLASISNNPTYADVGGLLHYSLNRMDIVERTASFVDRILRGAKPADLPVEQPTKYELVLNAKTAKAIGLKLSPSFMAQVDRVIE